MRCSATGGERGQQVRSDLPARLRELRADRVHRPKRAPLSPSGPPAQFSPMQRNPAAQGRRSGHGHGNHGCRCVPLSTTSSPPPWYGPRRSSREPRPCPSLEPTANQAGDSQVVWLLAELPRGLGCGRVRIEVGKDPLEYREIIGWAAPAAERASRESEICWNEQVRCPCSSPIDHMEYVRRI